FYPNPVDAREVTLHADYVKRVTGIGITIPECRPILTALGFEPVREDTASLTVKVPTFRPDVEREIDLVEEVLRINYLDKIPSMTRMTLSVAEDYDKFHPFITDLRNFFVGHGMHEAVNNSLIGETPAHAGIWGYKPLRILNPLSLEMNMLRTDMIQPLLTSLRSNALKKRSNIRLFELANVIEKDEHSETGAREHHHLGVLCCSPLWGLNWTEEDKAADIFYLKGVLDDLMTTLGFHYKLKECEGRDEFDILYDIAVKKHVIGKIGQYRSETFEKLQLAYPVAVMELQIEKLFGWYAPQRKYSPTPQFPSIFRDISLVADKKLKAVSILNEINQHGGKYLVDLVLYDMYIDDKKLGEDKKALSFRLEFRSDQTTLTDSEIDDVMNKLFERLKNQYGAQLR
ncbi:MAG: hypothetical protein JXR21_05180, partial [Candidatus Marinimicrobia bacterium]|nr:hypothetical protein [Candidatus Neomarinimicrobiota bacterium]